MIESSDLSLSRSRIREIRASSPLGASSSAPVRAAEPSQRSVAIVPGTPFTSAELAQYVDRIFDGAGVKEGDIAAVKLSHYSQRNRSVLRMMAVKAAQRGATLDLILPEATSKEQIDGLVDNDAVFISLGCFTAPGDEEPSLDLNTYIKMIEDPNISPELRESIKREIASLVAEREQLSRMSPDPDAWASYNAARAEDTVRWNVSMWPNEGWAETVYADEIAAGMSREDAYKKLGDDLRYLARCGPGDAEDALLKHQEKLSERAKKLSELDIATLEFADPSGTELRLDVAEGASFFSVEAEFGDNKCVVNNPTEECFTTPDPDSASGVMVASKPLMVNGQAVEGVKIRYERGRAVEVSCSDPETEPLLKQAFQSHPENFSGLDRVGEIGLVDKSSRVAELGRVFNNTIIDENAGVHLAHGNSYDAWTGGEGNRGKGHFDICFGTEHTNVTAITRDGRRVKLLEDGSWVEALR